MHRFPGGFQIEDPKPPGVVEESIEVEGLTLRALRPEHGNRDETIAKIRGHFEEQSAQVASSIDELRDIVGAHEPVELLTSVCVRASTRFMSTSDSLADDPATHTWPAKIEYLVGVALSLPAGAGSTPTTVTDRICALIDKIFTGTHAEQMLAAFEEESTGNRDLDEALFMLRLEMLTDRMPGYSVHLERIDAELFDIHRPYYVRELGFNPADVNRVVRRQLSAQRERTDEAMRRAQQHADIDMARTVDAMRDLFAAIDDMRKWTPNSVAAVTGLEAEELVAMFEFFSSDFGTQPDFRAPLDPNIARTYPIIRLSEGTYFVPDPYTLQEAIHSRLAELSTRGVAPKVTRYLKHRQDGHERLVTAALRSSFPPESVLENQHFSATERPGEVDVLVRASTPLIVEAKAHRLTESGRRGAPTRVERVAGEMLEKALTQTGLAGTYIRDEQGRSFASRQGRAETTLLDDVEGTVEVIVTFERMDPLAMLGPAILKSAHRAVWIVGIADLLMATDILRDGVTLHSYARTRAELTARGVRVYMESDALSAYLRDRLVPLRAHASNDPDQNIMLGYSSELINDYFTRLEMGDEASPPDTGLPEEIAAAMSTQAMMLARGWAKACEQVMTLDATQWRKWHRFSRRHKAGEFRANAVLTLVLGEESGLQAQDGKVRLVLRSNRRRRDNR